MKIEMKNIYDDKVLKDGCVVCFYDSNKNKTTCLFKEDYKEILIRSLVYMGAIFIFLYSFVIAIYLVDHNTSVLFLELLALLPVYLAFISPFIINIIIKKFRYRKTSELYELLCKNNNLVLDFGEFEIKLLADGVLLRSIYYLDLVNIELYENVIAFRSKYKKDNFFISSEYMSDVMSTLKELQALHLVMQFDDNYYCNVSHTSSRYFCFYVMGCFFIPSITSKLGFQILIGILWLVFLVVFSIFVSRYRSNKLVKLINNNNINGAFEYCDNMLKKGISQRDVFLFFKAKLCLFLNKLDESNKIIECLDKNVPKNNSYLSIGIIHLKFILFVKQKRIDEAKKILETFKLDIKTNKGDNSTIKKYKIDMYNTMKNALYVEETNSKEELIQSEKYFLTKLDDNKVLFVNKAFYWEMLMKIYRKTKNKKKEKEYMDLIKEYFGELYIFLD